MCLLLPLLLHCGCYVDDQQTLRIVVKYIHIIDIYFKTALHWIVWLEIETQSTNRLHTDSHVQMLMWNLQKTQTAAWIPLWNPLYSNWTLVTVVVNWWPLREPAKLYFSQSKLVELMERLESDGNRMGPHRLLHCAVASCDVSMMYGAPYARNLRTQNKPYLNNCRVSVSFNDIQVVSRLLLSRKCFDKRALASFRDSLGSFSSVLLVLASS